MSKLTLYYSVDNGGDGTAYPRWFDSEELATWHQDRLDDGWGEPCTGEIVVKGDNLQCEELLSKEGYFLDLLLDAIGNENNEERKEFKEKFFPDGLPKFTVKLIDDPLYYGIFVGDRLVYRLFAYPEKKANAKGVKKLEGNLI